MAKSRNSHDVVPNIAEVKATSDFFGLNLAASRLSNSKNMPRRRREELDSLESALTPQQRWRKNEALARNPSEEETEEEDKLRRKERQEREGQGDRARREERDGGKPR